MEDDSITGRPFLVWFEHQAKEMRLPRPVDEDTNYDEDVHTDNTYIISLGLSDEQASWPWGGIPTVYLFGDYNQPQPIYMKGIHNSTASKQIDSSGYLGRLPFQSFIHRHPGSGTDSLIVITDEVIR